MYLAPRPNKCVRGASDENLGGVVRSSSARPAATTTMAGLSKPAVQGPGRRPGLQARCPARRRRWRAARPWLGGIRGRRARPARRGGRRRCAPAREEGALHALEAAAAAWRAARSRPARAAAARQGRGAGSPPPPPRRGRTSGWRSCARRALGARCGRGCFWVLGLGAQPAVAELRRLGFQGRDALFRVERGLLRRPSRAAPPGRGPAVFRRDRSCAFVPARREPRPSSLEARSGGRR
jgi:hypothetical protein